MTSVFASIEQGVAALKNGRMVILVDEETRENEGDLVFAAEFVTAETINFMAKFGRGLICLSMAPELIDKLQLPQMTNNNLSSYGTAFTISIEAAKGVSTGISAHDRAHTIKVALDPNSTHADLISPGHVFPLRAQAQGVLKRAGQTEGSVDLVKLAGLTPAAVICEIINDDGTMSRYDDLVDFAAQHNILILSIKDLIDYRVQHEQLVTAVVTSRLPLQGYGDFLMTVFHNIFDSAEHFVLIKQHRVNGTPPLVRIHSECITGDVFGSEKCDCGAQLQQSLMAISQEESGVLVYLRQEGRGLGLANKIKAYVLQEQGYDTVEANFKLGLPADNRDYKVAFQILQYLGLHTIRLLTNNPQKVNAIEKYGINISERIPLNVCTTEANRNYLKAKQQKMGHFLTID